MKTRIQLLDRHHIEQKIKRIAIEIQERNYYEPELIFVGIKTDGFLLAEKLLSEFQKIAPEKKVHLFPLKINKANPVNSIEPGTLEEIDLNDKTIILVDDVANTGRTLLYALQGILNFLPKSIQVAVLVDRQHKRFPVQADFVGISLSTTLRETIRVEMEKDDSAVFLI